MSRLSQLTYEDMTPEQKLAHDEILKGPRDRIAGPMNAWFRSPALCDKAQKLGAFCRFESQIDPRVREFIILIVARRWSAQIEWWAHHPLALEYGLDPAIADALKDRRRPDFVNRDEELAHDFCNELLDTRQIGDETYQAMLDEFGEPVLVEIVALLGYYTSVAMILNTFQELPADGSLPFKD